MDKTPRREDCEQEPWDNATPPPELEVVEYLRDLATAPPLTDAEDRRLVADLRSAPLARQQDIRRQLIEGTLARAVEIARSYQGQGVPLADLIGIANLALVKAAQAFDLAATGGLFRQAAVPRMRREIKAHLKAVARHKLEVERDEENGVVDDEGWPLSLDAPPPRQLWGEQDPGQEEGTLRDLLAASLLYEEAAFDYDWALALRLRQGLALLPASARRVLELRYRLLGEAETDTLPRTLEEVGRILKVTRERVRQREERGIRFLRVYFASLRKRSPGSGGAPPPARAASATTTTPPPTAPDPSTTERKETERPPAKKPPATARPAPKPRQRPTLPPQEPALFRPGGSGQHGEDPGPIRHEERELTPFTTYGVARSWPNGWTENLAFPPVPHSVSMGVSGFGKSTLLKSLLAHELMNMQPTPPADPPRQAPAPLAFHSGGITALAFSPDGERLALVDREGGAWVYDAQRGDPPRIAVPAADEAYTHICWSPSGTQLAAASRRGSVRAWDARTGETTARYTAHGGPLRWIAWSPGGLRFAAADSHSLHLWQFPTHAEPTTLVIAPRWNTFERLAWSPDGRRMAMATRPRPPLSWLCGENHIRVLDTFTGEQIEQVPLGGDVVDLAWSPDGSRLATIVSAASSSRIAIWSVESFVLLSRSEVGHAGWLRWSRDGALVYVLQHDGDLVVLSAPTGDPLARTRLTHGSVALAAWSPNRGILAFTHVGGREVHFWVEP